MTIVTNLSARPSTATTSDPYFNALESDSALAGIPGGGVPITVANPVRERETIVTQDIPVRVLSAQQVGGLHEPQCPPPEVHIMLPPLAQLKAVSDRFTKLALATQHGGVTGSGGGGGGPTGLGRKGPRLEMAASMHGSLRLAFANDGLRISSMWRDLANPELDPKHVEGGLEGVRTHPSTLMKQRSEETEEGWARVRIDARDWGRVLSVGRLGGRVVACFCHDHALVLYVYLPNEQGADDSVLTYYVSSYSA